MIIRKIDLNKRLKDVFFEKIQNIDFDLIYSELSPKYADFISPKEWLL